MSGDKRPRRRRDLTSEERSLWDKVAETIRPLPGRKSRPIEKKAPPAKALPAPRARAAAPPPPPPAKPKAPPLAAIEPKLARTLKRGGAVDARFDLHGYRQDEAHSKLIWFLKSQQTRGARVVLVITGKSGVLNRAVPLWLAEPGLRNTVIGFTTASAAHGGSGALYVRLRRER